MKLADILKVLLEAKEKHGDQIECVVYTIGHGPFQMGCTLTEEDEFQHPHVQFGPEEEFECPNVYKDEETDSSEDEEADPPEDEENSTQK